MIQSVSVLSNCGRSGVVLVKLGEKRERGLENNGGLIHTAFWIAHQQPPKVVRDESNRPLGYCFASCLLVLFTESVLLLLLVLLVVVLSFWVYFILFYFSLWVVAMASCYPLSVSRPMLLHRCRSSACSRVPSCGTSSSLQTHLNCEIWLGILASACCRRVAPVLLQELLQWKWVGRRRFECEGTEFCEPSCGLRWRRRGGRTRGSKLACRAGLIEPAVRLVLADMDPENLQNLIVGASVLAATSASLYYGLKVIHPPAFSSSKLFRTSNDQCCSISWSIGRFRLVLTGSKVALNSCHHGRRVITCRNWANSNESAAIRAYSKEERKGLQMGLCELNSWRGCFVGRLFR